jgi:hypothetical protein
VTAEPARMRCGDSALPEICTHTRCPGAVPNQNPSSAGTLCTGAPVATTA